MNVKDQLKAILVWMGSTDMKFMVKPKPPFNFALSANFLSARDDQISNYSNGRYWRVLRAGDKLILATVGFVGDVDEPRLTIELRSNDPLAREDRLASERQIRLIFDVDFDLKPFYDAMKSDRVMSTLISRLRGLRCGSTPTVFEALIYSITEQQISLNVAFAIQRRLVKEFGDRLEIDGRLYYAFPTPARLASASVDDLQSCGLSMKKAGYIREISRMIVEGSCDVEGLKGYGDEEVIDKLRRIRGVGIWTAELVMVRGMHRFGVTPADDLGLRRCISRYYCGGRMISGDEARRIAERWGEWKGLASFYLIVANRLDLGI